MRTLTDEERTAFKAAVGEPLLTTEQIEEALALARRRHDEWSRVAWEGLSREAQFARAVLELERCVDGLILGMAQLVLLAGEAASSRDRGPLLEAAARADWQQVILNGGPPCFALAPLDRGSFCLRAERWEGYGAEAGHAFVSLHGLLS